MVFFATSGRIGRSKYPLSPVGNHFSVRDGDHNRLPDEEVTTAELGIRYLRAQDLCEGEITAEAPIYITKRYYATVGRSHIKPGSLLFSIMASIGNAAVVPTAFPPATANRAVGILVPKKEDPLLTRYLFFLFATDLGSELYTRIKKGGLQQRTNLADVEVLEFPLPPKNIRQTLVATMDEARAERQAKLAKADALIAGLDGVVFSTLGLTPPPKDDRKAFAVRLTDVERKQIGANLYAPPLRSYLRALATGPHPTLPLHKEVAVNPAVSLERLTDDSMISFIPMEAVEDKASGGITLRDRDLGEVKKGYTPFAEGDILWAKITPCMENGKSGIARGLTNKVGFGSTEFHVLRPRSSRVSAEYVHEFISQSALRVVARFAFTGSAGHQRVPAEFLEQLPLPVPPPAVQEAIATEARRRREDARRLRIEAEADWQAAKRWFEDQLLGPT